jgi:hypothetical protein
MVDVLPEGNANNQPTELHTMKIQKNLTAPDLTPCTVEVLGRDGTVRTVQMTKACFDASAHKQHAYAADQFLGRLVAVAGVPVVEDAPF